MPMPNAYLLNRLIIDIVLPRKGKTMSFFEDNGGWLIVAIIVLVFLFAFQDESGEGFFD